MSCLLAHGKSVKWISLLLLSKQGPRAFATKSHMKKMMPRTFENMVKSDKIVIFSKSNCCYSEAAKNLFKDINTKYTAFELDRREDGHLIQAHLNIVTGSPLMPRIFIVGRCVGGYCDLVELHQNVSLCVGGREASFMIQTNLATDNIKRLQHQSCYFN